MVTGEEKKKGSHNTIRLQFEADGFSPEYMFYRLHRLGQNGEFVPIAESETSRRTVGSSKHVFKQLEVHSAALFHDEENRKAMVELFQWFLLTRLIRR